MKDDFLERVSAIQDSMLESARPCFESRELEDLRALIRICVELHDYLEDADRGVPDPPVRGLTYNIQTVFSGVDSFDTVTGAYGVLEGATASEIRWGEISMGSLRTQFLSTFKDFANETKFERKCRLLLDLYKILIVFAGAFYDCEFGEFEH